VSGTTGGARDEYGDEVGQGERAAGVVGTAGHPAYGPHFVQRDPVPRQHVRQREECGAGVAVVERVEEAHVEVGAGGAGREREGRLRALREAVGEAVRKVGAGAVAFAALLGVRRVGAERRARRQAQHMALPGGEAVEGEGQSGGGVRAGQIEGGAQADGAYRGPLVVVGVDVLHRPVFYRGDRHDWEAFVRAGGKEPVRGDCACAVPGNRLAEGLPYP
jgi:hypothetical protein